VSADLVATMDRVAGKPGVGVLVPNGVDTTIFHPRDRAAARERLELDPRAPLVLVVGHWIPRKDPSLALEAFAKGAPPDARLVFVGKGPLEEALRAEIAARGLDPRVLLVGERAPADLAQWYAAADLVLLASRREGRPNVVLEALASGRPVLATDVGGTRELLSDVRMLARSREPAVLASGIGELLATPFDPAALARSVAHLSWEASLSAMERALDAAREHRARTR
jgi:glycosyltransferase involved in cell wall biosynthesis